MAPQHTSAPGLAEGRVVVVTGAGRGLGRAHALAFARAGARVVVNDLGVGLDGATGADTPAEQVAAEIRAAGGEAAVSTDDVADSAGAARLIGTALEAFGRLDTLVNNAGFLRDRMLVNLAEDDWDAVVRVHLKGHFLTMRHAGVHWRAESKAGRTPEAARIVNTSSGAGLLGAVGQGNYAAAKAGIAALTQVAAAEFGRYGVQVNAIAPAARTRMTEHTFAQDMAAPTDGGFDAMAPENVSPLVVYLGSAACAGITGRVFEAEGGRVTVMDGWRRTTHADHPTRWNPADLDTPVRDLLARAPAPQPVYGAR